MTIDEAIEDLQMYLKTLGRGDYHDYSGAVRLGVEALEAVKDCRANNPFCLGLDLEGETEEGVAMKNPPEEEGVPRDERQIECRECGKNILWVHGACWGPPWTYDVCHKCVDRKIEELKLQIHRDFGPDHWAEFDRKRQIDRGRGKE